ncbi:MAG: hypothetical protein ACM31O_14485 [Bacteroidota bacterium]
MSALGDFGKGKTHCMDEGFVPHRHDTWKWRYGDLKAPTTLRHWNGHDHERKGKPKFTEEVIPAGTTVKIVMASRFGDVGITTNLDAEHGYSARIFLDDLTNLRASA